MSWRIGDGESVWIYEDNWIPGTDSTRILSPRATALENSRMACLIDTDWGGWNSFVIES